MNDYIDHMIRPAKGNRILTLSESRFASGGWMVTITYRKSGRFIESVLFEKESQARNLFNCLCKGIF